MIHSVSFGLILHCDYTRALKNFTLHPDVLPLLDIDWLVNGRVSDVSISSIRRVALTIIFGLNKNEWTYRCNYCCYGITTCNLGLDQTEKSESPDQNKVDVKGPYK